MRLAAQLSEGIEVLGLALPRETQTRMLQYLALIRKWNQVHNLTAVREPEAMLVRHLLDSLAILPHVAGPRIADVGSGAGLPGIPLALARPEWRVTLVETNHKKTAFLQQARIELDLKNVEVMTERVENFHPVDGFDVVISRAFSDLADFAGLAGHLCAPGNGGGRLVAMKGVYPHEELAQLPAQFMVEKILPVTVPGLEAERHLVLIKQI
ncbi:16S rRNA m(7)G-527 methyltransferase [Nitrosospira sp. Nsp11]|jgi:16S rRNA (guanine527-N7)-methyltransferase|uniref:16S rRNA (guanine(527)-N(7))-methyltransferase RsmG n=1 Tax=Nitrosospira sp. Nsp11 TaxID=1855338 RepID=UPI00091261CF|nr:16S rRNA (guanine(527)-N(7))-methyltransferase RsmG [Nitrosospira sp. Nsp11]SHM25254.1 16S rRNA m(7)G-527 methyltransferase [Nitrosospira sp. Nsp11]